VKRRLIWEARSLRAQAPLGHVIVVNARGNAPEGLDPWTWEVSFAHRSLERGTGKTAAGAKRAALRALAKISKAGDS